MINVLHPSTLLQSDWITTIRQNSFAAETAGVLQPAQLELIYQQQWFKLLVPATYNGLEMPLNQLVRLEEALAWADGSLGWVITLCAGAGWFGGFIAPDAAAEIFADPKVCLAGSGASTGTAQPHGDSYLINGSWKYASGVLHATHFTANCVIDNGEGGNDISSFIIDAAKAQLVPAWKYIGMMGTGSHAFKMQYARVAANRAFKIAPESAVVDGKLYQYPFLQLAETTLAANLSGMAIHFIDICENIFAEKLRHLSTEHQSILNATQQQVKDKLQSIRNQFYEELDASWQQINAQNKIDENTLKLVSSTSRQLAVIARQSVDQLYSYCGLQAASPDTEINQVWRDLHTASQHSLLTFLT